MAAPASESEPGIEFHFGISLEILGLMASVPALVSGLEPFTIKEEIVAIAGRATPSGTAAFCERAAPSAVPEHYRQHCGLHVSSIGLGTYLGHWDDRTDQMYHESVKRAIELGCNLIDSAINYRFQRSERAIGAALKQMHERRKIRRDEIVLATKGGFFPSDGEPAKDLGRWIRENVIDTGAATPDEIVDSHCMAPGYLKDQLARSLENLGLDTVDIYYIHNPETQLEAGSRPEFLKRIRAAFELLELAVAEGKIQLYGTATWNGYRLPAGSPGLLSLSEIESIAREVAGASHHCRVVQLPLSLMMPEALTEANQIVDGEQLSPIEAANRLGVAVICSASLNQGRLAQGLPAFVASALKGLNTDAQRAIQFTRSAPGVTSALVGMSHPAHVEENMMVAKIPPAAIEEFLALFGSHEMEGQ